MNLFTRLERIVVDRIWKYDSLINKLLRPVSWVYLIIHLINFTFRYKKKAKIPVVCVGNLTSGGSGKTPLVLAIATIIKHYKKNLAFIGHGYKAHILKDNLYAVVDLKKHNAYDVGDEAMLLSQLAPTYVSKKRMVSILAAQADDMEIVILDDGFQDGSVYKDLSILVVDSEYIFGNGLLLPAGPLRELPVFALRRADLIFISGINKEKIEDTINFIIMTFSKSVVDLKSKISSCIITPQNLQELKEKDFFAIIGIAHPAKFLNLAKKYAINIKENFIFSDHYVFDAPALDLIYSKAIASNCEVITSSKDFTRLPEKYKKLTKVIEIRADILDSKLIEFLRNQIGLD